MCIHIKALEQDGLNCLLSSRCGPRKIRAGGSSGGTPHALQPHPPGMSKSRALRLRGTANTYCHY